MLYTSGALDVTEEIAAAVAIPHVPQVWEEIHRSHCHTETTQNGEAASV